MIKILKFEDLVDRKPKYQQINGLDLVLVRYDENVSVLYGRCLHRGALMADGYIGEIISFVVFMVGIIVLIQVFQMYFAH